MLLEGRRPAQEGGREGWRDGQEEGRGGTTNLDEAGQGSEGEDAAWPAPGKGLLNDTKSQWQPSKTENETYKVVLPNPLETSDSVTWVFDLFALFQKLL